MLTLTKRNLLLYLKNKNLIVFSMLSVMIILGLYIFFLGQRLEGTLVDYDGANLLVASWLLAGIIGIMPINISMGSLANIIIDRQRGTYYDLTVAPVSKRDIVVGYVLSTFIVSLIFSLATYFFTLVYLVAIGYQWPTLFNVLQVTAIIVFNALTATVFVFMFALSFKSTDSFSVFNSILGTVIGFLAGILIPLGSLASPLQFIVKLFPFSHSVLLLRNIIMDAPMTSAFENATASVIEGFKSNMGLNFGLDNQIMHTSLSLVYLGLVLIVTFFICIRRVSKMSIEDQNW